MVHESTFVSFDSIEMRRTLHALLWRGSPVLIMTAEVHGHRRVVCVEILLEQRDRSADPETYVESYVPSEVLVGAGTFLRVDICHAMKMVQPT